MEKTMPQVSIEYTADQLSAIEIAVDGFRNGLELTIVGGFAGTGKTTIIKEIVDRVRNLQVVTFTGKASSVIRSKGVDSQTIHSTIYEYDPECDDFFLRTSVECDGFIIDEASMVSTELYTDLQTFGLPILAVGDPGQLEPIGDASVNLMEEPDITLTEIHRQAKFSEIINLATRIRTEGAFGLPLQEKPGCIVARASRLGDELSWPDIILCGYNKTRQLINQRRRSLYGYRETVCVGDKLICLQNDKKLGVFNGMIFTVVKIFTKGKVHECLVKLGDDTLRRLSFWTKGLEDPEKLTDYRATRGLRGETVVADYAQGITVHKSQGSEWERGSVINQTAKWDQTRWLYTAVTRFSKELRLYI